MFFDLWCTEDEVEVDEDEDEGDDGDFPLSTFPPLPFLDLSSSLWPLEDPYPSL